jgi:protease-4
MKDWQKIILLIIIIFICVGTFYYLTLENLFKGTPTITRDSYLELKIYGDVPERDISNVFDTMVGGEIPSLDVLLHSIRKAKIDPKIQGIILIPMGLSLGWGKMEELKQALKDFKQSGKKVYAYLEVGGNREYYISLEADLIFGAPRGVIFVNGLLSGGYYLKGTLDKIGVKADFVVQGEYKSAPEIFTDATMSPARRRELNTILDDFFVRYIRELSEARGIEPDIIKQLVDYGIYSLQDAYENNLIDTLMYYDEFKEYLNQINGRAPRLVSLNRYKQITYDKLGIKGKRTIALIYFIGDIVSGFGSTGAEEGLIISEGMAEVVREATDNSSVEAIVLRIDSPGGSGIAADIIWDAIMEAREKKPVIVSMSDVAASGGYYIAMPADTILAQESSIVGSIGVYSGKFAMKGLYEKLGINKIEIQRGENATLLSELNTWSPKQRKILQDQIQKYYHSFVTKVAEARNRSYEEIDEIAQGRVWTGSQSIENGLIDKIGGLNEAIDVAKKMIGLSKDSHVKLLVYPEERSFIDRLLSGDFNLKSEILTSYLPGGIQNYFKGYLYFQEYEPLFILPFYPEIY